jgi:hypothetical protein
VKAIISVALWHRRRPSARVPRVSRLMALAICFEHLVRDGAVADYAELARLGHVTRPRMTQIMNLLNLAPDIQEALLLLPRVERGKDPITERELRPIAAVVEWGKQRRRWRQIDARRELTQYKSSFERTELRETTNLALRLLRGNGSL